MQKYIKPISLILLLLTAIVLIPLQIKFFGWSLWAITIIVLLFSERHYRRDMLLVVASIGLLGITKINIGIGFVHIFQMAIPEIPRQQVVESGIVFLPLPYLHNRLGFAGLARSSHSEESSKRREIS